MKHFKKTRYGRFLVKGEKIWVIVTFASRNNYRLQDVQPYTVGRLLSAVKTIKFIPAREKKQWFIKVVSIAEMSYLNNLD